MTVSTAPRVEIADPSPEGPAIADALRARGFHVVERPIASLEFGSEAAVLILAGDAPDAHSVLRALRRSRGTAATPVVLLGGPHDDVLSDAHYARPVPIERLVRKVETYLAPPETRLRPSPSDLTTQPPMDAGFEPQPKPIIAGVPIGGPIAPSLPKVERTLRLAAGQDPHANASIVAWQPPERTMQLVEDGSSKPAVIVPAGAASIPDPPPEGPIAKSASATPSSAGGAAPASAAPSVSAQNLPPSVSAPLPLPDAEPGPPPPAAEISPRLSKMLRSADKRVFPDLPRIEMRFPLGDEPPEVLVPEELLEPASQPIEPLEEDPLEQFTYVVGVPEHVSSNSVPVPLPRSVAGERLTGSQKSPRPGDRESPRSGAADDDATPSEVTSPTGSLRRSGPPPPLTPSEHGPSVTGPPRRRSAPPPPPASTPPPRRGSAPPPPSGAEERKRIADDRRPRPGATTSPSSKRAMPRGDRPMVTPVDVGAWTVTDPVLGEPTSDGRGRRGRIDDAGGFRILWRIAELRLEGRLALALDLPDGAGAISLRMALRGGEPVEIEGPAATRVLAQLRDERRAHEVPEGEREADAILERRAAAGAIGRFELDRRLRHAAESLIHDAVGAISGAFELRPLEGEAPPVAAPAGTRLGAPVRAVLLEGARRRLSPERVARLLGHGPLVVRLRGEADGVFADAEIEPETAALLRRHDGAPLDALLGSADHAEGLAGAIFALSMAGAVRVVPAEPGARASGDSSEAVQAALDAAAALAEDGDYFAILGTTRDALDRELRVAYTMRRRELRALPLAAHGLDHLEDRRTAALDAVEEAYEVLRDASLRGAYRAALDV